MDEFNIELNRLIYIEERMDMLAFEGETFKHSNVFNKEEADRLTKIKLNQVAEKKAKQMVEDLLKELKRSG